MKDCYNCIHHQVCRYVTEFYEMLNPLLDFNDGAEFQGKMTILIGEYCKRYKKDIND